MTAPREKPMSAAEQEIVRLDSENIALRASLIRIRDLCQQTGVSFEDQSFKATEIATKALKR